MRTIRSASALALGVGGCLIVIICAGCASLSSPADEIATTSDTRREAIPSSSADRQGEPAPAGEEVPASIVIQGTFDGSLVVSDFESELTFCDQRGPVRMFIAFDGDVARGTFTGDAPEVVDGDCGLGEVSGYWEIDTSDPDHFRVLTCVVNDAAIESAVVLREPGGFEVECTSEGVEDGMLLTTTFRVDV